MRDNNFQLTRKGLAHVNLTLQQAKISDAEQILKMQVAAFSPMLEKYQDYDISPAAESIDRVRERFKYFSISQYFILKDCEKIGVIRIRKLDEDVYKLVQIFVLPRFQNNGYAQQAIALSEELFPKIRRWELETIKQEKKLCYLYEKLGYTLAGQEKNVKDGMDLVFYQKIL